MAGARTVLDATEPSASRTPVHGWEPSAACHARAMTTLLIAGRAAGPDLSKRTWRSGTNGILIRSTSRRRAARGRAIAGPEVVCRHRPVAAAEPSTISAPQANRIERVTGRGDALATFPPIVPRFWIWAAPIVVAASTSAGRNSATSGSAGLRRSSALRARGRRARPRCPAARRAPRCRARAWRLADLAGGLDHDVGAAGDRAPRLFARRYRPAGRMRQRGVRPGGRLGHRRASVVQVSAAQAADEANEQEDADRQQQELGRRQRQRHVVPASACRNGSRSGCWVMRPRSFRRPPQSPR